MKQILLIAWGIVFPFVGMADSRVSSRLVISSETLEKLKDPTLFKTGSDEVVPFTLYYRGRVSVGTMKPRLKSLVATNSNLPSPALFQGRLKRLNGRKFHVAGSLYDNVLTVSFNNGRDVFTAVFYLSDKSLFSGNISGELHRVPSYVRIDDQHVVTSLPALSGNSEDEETLNALGLSSQASRVIELSTVADEQYVALKGSSASANAQILSTVNTADTLYNNQLDIEFSVLSQNVAPNGSFTTSAANPLLAEFRSYGLSNSSFNSDIVHLFTGRNLDGSTIGLAYLSESGFCPLINANFGYGLTQMRSFEALSGIIFAHEVGHNLGATHDDDTTSLMSSSVALSQDQFSSFSLSEINSSIDIDPSCLQSSGEETPTYTIGKIKLTSGGTFKLVANLTSGDATSCTIAVYGAAKSGKLSSANILSKGEFITSFNGTLGSSKVTTQGLPVSLTKEKVAKFRLRVDCGDNGVTYSAIKTLTISDGGNLGLKSWINTLKTKTFSATAK